MTKVFLPGQDVSNSRDDADWPDALSRVMTGKVIAAGRVTAGSRGTDKESVFTVDGVKPNDIMEIELEDGLKIWQSVQQVEADFQSDASRSGTDDALLLPRELTFSNQQGQSRGIGRHVVRAIRVLRGDPVADLGKATALAVAAKIEESNTLAFCRCTRMVENGRGQIKLVKANPSSIPSSKPILVFVHGTFSSTQGSFGDLAAAPAREVWEPLERAYPGGIFALEHRSVTESPVKNAIDLVNALPRNAQVSLLSHSRGGMIAELVSRAAREDASEKGAIDDDDVAIFEKLKGRGSQVEELKDLRKALADKKLRVRRVVRVAGPLAGTTLASERLDRYLSVALNVFELIPVLRHTGAADLLKSFLMGFIQTKADPAALPGLEAMMPTSPLTRMLNRTDVTFGNGLRVIGGDTEGAGVLRRLGVLAADMFFRADHDFVVDTASMTRGGPRARQTEPFLAKGPDVSHFSYFHNADSRREIIGAAIEDEDSFLLLPRARAAAADQSTSEDLFADLVARGSSDDPVCFILPGVMGSHLAQDGDWIWTNPARIVFGGLDRIRMEQDGVASRDPIKTYFWDLCRYMSRTHKVIPFGYDWRLSILEQGHKDTVRKLGQVVETELNRTDKPIRFLAHSMGGLVVRALFHARPDLWARIKQRPGSRFVMLGTPNGGAFSMMHTLLGRASAIRKLELADIKHDLPELLEIVAGMHGALQLLPSNDNGRYLTDAFWDQLHSLHGQDWVKPTRSALEIARAGHKALAAHQFDPDLTCYVAGFGTENTPSSVRLDPTAEGANRIRFFATPEGDGTVTWATGIPQGVPTWYVNAIHGDMPRTKSAYPAYLDLLQTGTTARLSRQPPAISRGRAETGETEVIEPAIELFPDQQEILDDLLGAGGLQSAPLAAPRTRTTVTVLHGNLRFASYPVAVGHYVDDPMMGAEKALDWCLDRTLTNVRNLGLYPGKLDTCEVILREDCSPSGAIVVGLGPYGELTPGELKNSFRQAVLRYGMVNRERQAERPNSGETPEPLGMSTLLIGHQGTNITIQQSVEAILQAVAEANEALGDNAIAHLEFVELYDDTVSQAAIALDHSQALGRMGDMFSFDGEIRTVPDARVRTHYGKQTDWWQRIIVQQNKTAAEGDGENGDRPGTTCLDYTAISDNARADFSNSAYQPRILQQLVTQRTEGTAVNRDVGRLLFELLVPGQMKSFAKNNENILLILDKHTAAYPWELMEDDFQAYEFTGATPDRREGRKRETRPLVVRAPVIRRLITSGPNIPQPNGNRALIVGDPKSNLPALSGARDEAIGVNDLLKKAGWDCMHLDQPENGFDVISEMLLHPASLIHLAGHGVYASDTYDRTGMVLGNDLFLTASEIKQMSYVPEFVFLNCCHVGHAGSAVNEIAASLSVAFVKRGVRAVIAAGWEVDDAAAKLFARTFYTAMLAGNTFGKSVHLAREQVFEAHSDTNTWGAYQCYGDPDFRFRTASISASTSSSQTRYYSPQQATRAARNIAERAGSTDRRRASLMSRLVDIELSARDSWYQDSEWCAAMGTAYARISAFDAAIGYLEKSMQGENGGGSFEARQRLEDLRVRQASRIWQASVRDQSETDETEAAKGVREAVRSALQCYEQLDKLAGGRLSVKRECQKGAALKCRAMVDTGAVRQRTLVAMTECYRTATEVARVANPDRTNLYAAINWLSGTLILDLTKSDKTSQTPVSISVWLDRLAAESRLRDQQEPSFDNGIVHPQTVVLRGLYDPDTANSEALADINNRMKRAWRRGGSFRRSQKLRDQIMFIKAMMKNTDSQRNDWLNRIERIVQELTGDFDL